MIPFILIFTVWNTDVMNFDLGRKSCYTKLCYWSKTQENASLFQTSLSAWWRHRATVCVTLPFDGYKLCHTIKSNVVS